MLPLRWQQILSKPAVSSASPLSFLLPQFQQQSRNAHILASLSDTPGAYNKRIRRGRGPASGKGKTSGRGHKGQKQHGKVPAGFNGGQTPEIVVHGERGFNNVYVLALQGKSAQRKDHGDFLTSGNAVSPSTSHPPTSTASRNGLTKAASTQPAPSPFANWPNPAASTRPRTA